MMAWLRPQTHSPLRRIPVLHAFVVVACVCLLLDILTLRNVHSFSAIAPIHHEDRITPFHSPEDVVRRQLDAFQRSDIQAAFACGSTEHQDVCGPTSQEFKELLLSEPAFSTLIGHTKSTVLMTTDCADGEGKCCYVRIVPSKWKAISSSSDTHHQHQLHKRSCLEYWFELSKTTTPTTQSQQNNEEEEDSTWTHIAANLLIDEEGHETEEGCWKIDSILPDFEDLSLVSFEADDHDDDTVEDGIYYVNNNVNHRNIDTDTDADADDDDDQQQQQQQQQQQDQLRQIGNDIDEISQIIIKNMIQQTVVDSNDTDDDEDDGVTEYE